MAIALSEGMDPNALVDVVAFGAILGLALRWFLALRIEMHTAVGLGIAVLAARPYVGRALADGDLGGLLALPVLLVLVVLVRSAARWLRAGPAST